MEKAKVYFTSFRTPGEMSITDKLKKLLRRAGMDQIDFEGKFVAIKLHFGELGNLSYLRPAYARAVADEVKRLGGKPFLVDCNTLYPGSRKNALDHLECAAINGFNPTTTGCQVIIGDGLKGTDEVEVPVAGAEYCKVARIGRAVMDADIFISLSHFKGHESTGFGGAIKNIGMGCGSRAGKWISIRQASPRCPSVCAGAASCVPANAAAMPSAMRAARRTFTRISVWAAAAALADVILMPSMPPTTAPTNCWTAKWPSMPRPCAMAARASM